MTRTETIGDCTLYLGDCREAKKDERVALVPRRKPWSKTAIKSIVACKACDWTWKPSTGFGHEPCPKCNTIRSVRDRNYDGKANIASLKKHISGGGRRTTEWDRTYRRRAVMLVGRGILACSRCGCNRPDLLEINHKNGGGGVELRALKGKFYRAIAKMDRSVDDLELLCRPCNAVHALELKFGPLPFRVVWEGGR